MLPWLDLDPALGPFNTFKMGKFSSTCDGRIEPYMPGLQVVQSPGDEPMKRRDSNSWSHGCSFFGQLYTKLESRVGSWDLLCIIYIFATHPPLKRISSEARAGAKARRAKQASIIYASNGARKESSAVR